MSRLILNHPTVCPACHGRAGGCTVCGGERLVPLRVLMERASAAALDTIIAEAQELLGIRFSATGKLLTLEEVAALKNVTAAAVSRLLADEPRRAEFFPGARFTGSGARGVWQIPAAEAQAWTPKKHGKKRYR